MMLIKSPSFFQLADGPPMDLDGAPCEEPGSQDTRRETPMVLVVDDHKLIADTICEILRNSGYQAVAANDGWSALDLANRFRPEYLISDVLMPKMNGMELAIAVSKMYPRTKILLFSGQAGISEILQDGHRQGYEFDLIPKPIHPLKLIDHLKRMEK
jgi:CheY-like chemotaxis protein